VLGFDRATDGDEVFRQLVCAPIIEPTSKQDSLRVLDETGVAGPSYPTLNRRLPVFANAGFRQALSKACADRAALGSAAGGHVLQDAVEERGDLVVLAAPASYSSTASPGCIGYQTARTSTQTVAGQIR
jgi:hypothetical protein